MRSKGDNIRVTYELRITISIPALPLLIAGSLKQGLAVHIFIFDASLALLKLQKN